MKKITIISLFINQFLFSSDIARVLELENEAFINRGNKLLYLKNGSNIKENDYINTTDNSNLKILFMDGTTLDIKNNSSLRIVNYNYEDNPNLNLMISNGEFELKSGMIPINNIRINTDNSIFLAKCSNMRITISENIENLECISNYDEMEDSSDYETIKNPLESDIDKLSNKDFLN